MKREGMIYFVLLHSVAQENHNSTSVEENYFHSPGIFQASLCFDNLFSVKLPYLSNTLVFPGELPFICTDVVSHQCFMLQIKMLIWFMKKGTTSFFLFF